MKVGACQLAGLGEAVDLEGLIHWSVIYLT